MKLRQFYVYIMTNRSNEVIYIGMTADLRRRVYEHHNRVMPGFTSKYKTTKLVYFDVLDTAESAIEREKQLKRWHRNWKLGLIKRSNPTLRDLSEGL